MQELNFTINVPASSLNDGTPVAVTKLSMPGMGYILGLRIACDAAQFYTSSISALDPADAGTLNLGSNPSLTDNIFLHGVINHANLSSATAKNFSHAEKNSATNGWFFLVEPYRAPDGLWFYASRLVYGAAFDLYCRLVFEATRGGVA